MKKQIKDLELWEVDYLVAKAEELDPIRDGINAAMIQYKLTGITGWKPYEPTTNPAQAWPIIERERISVIYLKILREWSGIIDEASIPGYGKTLLEAAMKCYLASVYGDEVEI
jgi:hypothetical protein